MKLAERALSAQALLTTLPTISATVGTLDLAVGDGACGALNLVAGVVAAFTIKVLEIDGKIDFSPDDRAPGAITPQDHAFRDIHEHL